MAASGSVTRPRIVELDSLRGIAALAVVIYHYGTHFHVHPFERLLAPAYQEGWRAVDFFFVLSGFVLARAYWSEGRRKRLLSNSWDRVARLYPLHLVTLVFVAIGQLLLVRWLSQTSYVYQLNDGYRFALNLFLVHGLESSFNGPSWSISTEFLVNVFFFFVIVLPRRIAIICAIAIVLLTFGPYGHGPLSVAVPILRTLRGFFVGALVWLILVKLAAFPDKWVARSANIVFTVTALSTVTYSYLITADSRYGGGIILLLFMLLIASVPISSVASTLLRRTPLVFLGEISYSVYLVHFPLQLLLWLLSVTLTLSWPYDQSAALFAFLSLTIGCAALTYRSLELPGKRWLRSNRWIATVLGHGRSPAGGSLHVATLPARDNELQVAWQSRPREDELPAK